MFSRLSSDVLPTYRVRAAEQNLTQPLGVERISKREISVFKISLLLLLLDIEVLLEASSMSLGPQAGEQARLRVRGASLHE